MIVLLTENQQSTIILLYKSMHYVCYCKIQLSSINCVWSMQAILLLCCFKSEAILWARSTSHLVGFSGHPSRHSRSPPGFTTLSITAAVQYPQPYHPVSVKPEIGSYTASVLLPSSHGGGGTGIEVCVSAAGTSYSLASCLLRGAVP